MVSRHATERIRRVRAELKAGTSINTRSSPSYEPELLAHVTPLLAVLDSSSGVTLALVMPTKFDTPHKKKLDAISVSELTQSMPACLVTCYVMMLSNTASSSNELVFGGGQLGPDLVLSGLLVQIVDPEVRHTQDGSVQWVLPLFSLEVLLTLAWSGVERHFFRKGHKRGIDQQELPMLSDGSIYHDSTGRPRFIVDGTESGDVSGLVQRHRSSGGGATAGSVVCELCQFNVTPPAMMRQQIGAHLLQESWALYHCEKPVFPCGLCGVRGSIG